MLLEDTVYVCLICHRAWHLAVCFILSRCSETCGMEDWRDSVIISYHLL